jgi:excisionase family DNA binding protein
MASRKAVPVAPVQTPAPPVSNQSRGFNRKRAAEYLGIAGWALRVLIWNGELKPIRVGRRDVFDRPDLDAWFDKRKKAA